MDYILSTKFLYSLLVILIMCALLVIIKKYLIKRVAYSTSNKAEQKASTFIGMLFSVLQYLVVLIAAFIVMGINGIDITAQLAGLGIVATIIGLALQDTFKDILSGITIYNNNFYKVHDVVKYNGEICEVKYFNARVTKFRNVFTNSTYTVCNSNINNIEKIKDTFFANVVIPFETDYETVMKCLEEFKEEASQIEGMKNVVNVGVYNIDDRGSYYGLVYNMEPIKYYFSLAKINDILIKKMYKYNIKPTYEHHLMVENIDEHK